MSIKDSPVQRTERPRPPHHANHRQRLRGRFLKADPHTFPDYELLEFILFHSIERVDVKPLAKDLIAEFGSLAAVIAADPKRLAQHKRITDRTIGLFRAIREVGRRMIREEIQDRPVIASWDRLVDYCRATLAEEPNERFHVLYLNRRNVLIADEQQQKGTVDHTPVYPREVVRRALDLGASALIMVHNHPSGDPTPSQADIDMTHAVREAAAVLGIHLLDHVIVGRHGTRSLRALGVL